jgi:predicted DNA-binding transcriptional regulator YafY
MPRKLDDNTYGEKLIRLFAQLLFTSDKYSLNRLAEMLKCSKPTVIRLIKNIEQVYGAQIESITTGRERYISMKKTRRPQPAQCLTADEATLLQMCKSFTKHLVGPDFNTMVQSGILKSRQLLPHGVETSADLFASFHHGTIDYTAHQLTITTLIQAMRDLKVCCITYRAAMDREPKTFYIKPLKMLSHNNTLYVLAQMARTPGRPYKTPRFDPLLAVHRMVQVEMTDTPFAFPSNFDFDKVFDKSYGFMQEDHFKVTVRLTGWAKGYMCERIWSKDQKIKENPDGSADITFTAASESELISFILSLGDKARILKPKWLVGDVKNKIQAMAQTYEMSFKSL